MLKLTNITKDYKIASGVVHALKGVSLEFRKNEFVCILGQSGCGKTTLLNIIGGLDHYTSGDLEIQGRSTRNYRDRDWDVYRNHRIGFVFQTYNLIPHQTVLSNVELALTIAGMGKAERRERAKRALERVGLGEELNKRPNQLSGGQMQRVAIARALVNDPDILLADEPTGALDSKTSVQIMDLIKEIAGERLVIMVTHNPELAEQYASRIVRLKDGLVESDSDPYHGTEEEHAAAASFKETGTKADGKGKKHRAKMGLLTSVALSFRNLLTKKGRTIITSVAGSIGIISVCLVLALSNGFGNYMRHTEEDMLSAYPIEVTETALDYSAVMDGISSPSKMPDLKELEAGNKLYINSFLTNLAQGVAIVNTITPEYIEYLEKGVQENPEAFAAVQYSYGFGMTDALFTHMTVGGEKAGREEEERIFSVEALKEFLIKELIDAPGGEQYQGLLRFVNLFTDVFNKMPGTAESNRQAGNYGEYVLSQYDVIAGDFPEDEHGAVLVVGPDNDVIDLTLVQLGFLTEEEFLTLFDIGLPPDATEDPVAALSSMRSAISLAEDGGEADDPTLLPFSKVFDQPYVLYHSDELYTPNENYVDEDNLLTNSSLSGGYPFQYSADRNDLEVGENGEKGIDFKITGILRLKKGLTYGCLEEGLNLPEATVNKYIELNKDSKIAQWTREKSEVPEGIRNSMKNLMGSSSTFASLFTEGTKLYFSPAEPLNGNYQTLSLGGFACHISTSVEGALRALGADDTPNAISIYPVDFEAKDSVKGYLNAWNATHSEEEQIKYTDRVGLLMGMIQTIFNLITYVLVAFTAISLVVSSVMIGIITYVSVVERTKEIGVLRSLGARKQDIRNLFNAETFIIGLAAGLIGVVVTYLLSAIISAVIFSLSGIAGLAALPPLTAFIMVCVSVVLTLISGLIPAQAAAKKDPVIALRAE